MTAEPDHGRLGVDLFNGTWELMEKADRTPDEDVLMIHMAHASAYHWLQVGAPENTAQSHWQCSRMYTVLAHAASADISDDDDRAMVLTDLATIPT